MYHSSVKSKQSSQASDGGLAVKYLGDLLRNRQEMAVEEVADTYFAMYHLAEN